MMKHSVLIRGARMASFTAMPQNTLQYTPRKQLIYAQCVDYLKAPNFLLLQLDNLSTATRVGLKSRLKALGMSLKTPKAHILKKVLRCSGLGSLETGTIGFVGVAIAGRLPHELKEALAHLQSRKDITVLGGKMESHLFTNEGIAEYITELPSLADLRLQLVSQLSQPASMLSNSLINHPMHLARLLQQHLAMNSNKEDSDA